MAHDLRIDFEWMERESEDAIARSFFAGIGISAAGEVLTRIEDLSSRTVRSRMRGCAHSLAHWFAANWWRLRWEPAPAAGTGADWRMAHCVAAAGGGYLWPPLHLASDGESVEAWVRPNPDPPPFEPVRYLAASAQSVPAQDFELGVDGFVDAVVARLSALELPSGLPALWQEVRAERFATDGTAEFRKLEAMMGFDPDGAPEGIVESFSRDAFRFGSAALEEVAAASGRRSAEVADAIGRLGSAGTAAGAVRARLPVLDSRIADTGTQEPWARAAKLARRAREAWNLGTGPITDAGLATLVEAAPDRFTGSVAASVPMPIALMADGDAFDLYFPRPLATSRRFALARLIGARASCQAPGRLLPATSAKTARQKFQRAFAQEFLCPLASLLEYMPSEHPDEDDIAAAAEHFRVSPLLVRTTLVNNRIVGRDVLDWTG